MSAKGDKAKAKAQKRLAKQKAKLLKSREGMKGKLAGQKAKQAGAMLALKKKTEAALNDPKLVALREKKARRRRRTLMLILILLLLLLLLLRCECKPEVPLPPVPVAKVSVPVKVKPPVKKKRKLRGKVKAQDRSALVNKRQKLPAWLPQFKIQVGARDVAPCFAKAKNPGALRWSVNVAPRSGEVSDGRVDPVFSGVTLTARQKICVLDVLSAKPVYRLDEDDPQTLSQRVSIVFEF